MEHTEEYVKLENVSKIYGSKEVKIIAVDEISFRISRITAVEKRFRLWSNIINNYIYKYIGS